MIMNSLTSTICSVTVYADRAQVTRKGVLNLKKGTHKIVFDELPDKLDKNSIQVSGLGQAQLKDVKFKKKYYEDIPDEKIKKLNDDKTQLLDILEELNDSILNADSEKEFVKRISNKLTDSTKKTDAAELIPEKWIKMVEFHRRKLDELDAEIRDIKKKKRDVEKRLAKTEAEITNAGSNRTKVTNTVELLADVKTDGEMEFFLSYIVKGPSWRPVYDLRIDSEKKSMNLTYNAIIKQNSSENWENVELKLSTAQPKISGTQPELSPWRIDIYKPPVYNDAVDFRAKTKKAAVMPQMFAGDTPESYGKMDSKKELMEVEEASVETGATSVVFGISGGNTINSDNEDHKVCIMIHEFDAHFRYSTVPKLSQYAYLKAKVLNSTEYPFLSGESNIFLDGSFVAKSKLNLVAPGEEFWIFLGVDESIKVEYKFIKKFEKTEGLISKRTKFIYNYLIEITNKKKTAEEIVVWDQLPITHNDDINVELIEPVYKKDSEKLKMNEFRYLEWFFKIKPLQKIEIPFNFSVEYPRDEKLTGL